MREPAGSERGAALERAHLGFLDGVRGAAALYVALYHAAGDVRPATPLLRLFAWPLQFGHYAVGVFIVLSGFCLMMPVARSAAGRIEGGFRAYARRRARRLLPAYYVALALAVAAVTVVRMRYAPLDGEEADALRLDAGTVLSHLFLVHNLHEHWAQAFDPPMWSVAAEFQIYLLFPLVLLPIWRALGVAAVVVCGLGLGLAPHLLLPARCNLDWTFPWYAGLFALGMAGAAVTFSVRERDARYRERVPWGWSAAVLAGLFLAFIARYPNLPPARMWLPDILLGCAMTAVLVRCAVPGRLSTTPKDDSRVWRVLVRLLESRGVRRIGACSYSLYLLHAPIFWALTVAFATFHLRESLVFILRLALGVPLAVALSHGFYVVVERPFLQPSHR